jgi:hypothetical protein
MRTKYDSGDERLWIDDQALHFAMPVLLRAAEIAVRVRREESRRLEFGHLRQTAQLDEDASGVSRKRRPRALPFFSDHHSPRRLR